MKLIQLLVLLLVTSMSYAGTAWKDVVWLKAGREPNLYYSAQYLIEDGVFRVYVMRNLPESEIIGAPESEVTEVQGSCTRKEFSLMGTAFFSGEKATGMLVDSINGDLYRRRMTPQSEFYAIFKSICGMK